MNNSSTYVVTPRAVTRLSRLRPVVALSLFLAVCLAVLMIVPSAVNDSRTLGPDNPRPDGAKALVRVLEAKGIRVKKLDRARAVIAQADEDTTVVVTFPFRMSSDVEQAISSLPSLVYIGTEQNYSEILPGVEPQVTSTTHTSPIPASCSSPTAQRAGTVASDGYGLSPSDSSRIDDTQFNTSLQEPHSGGARDPQGQNWTFCFPQTPDSYAYAELTDGSHYRAILADSKIIRNSTITTEGHGALALGAIGRTPKVIWYTASPSDSLTEAADLQPAWLIPSLIIVLVGLFVAGASRGRRLGRLVPENIPTQVPNSEILIGRGRLLRKNRAFEYSADSLRAASMRRIATHVGFSSLTHKDALRAALLQRGVSAQKLDDLLWGPTPRTNRELVDLAHRLAELEKEIHS